MSETWACPPLAFFILPPSFELLRERLTGRGTESAAQLALRLSNARREVLEYEHFDYVVVNDEAERAAARLQAIIEGSRARRASQEQTIQTILATFAGS